VDVTWTVPDAPTTPIAYYEVNYWPSRTDSSNALQDISYTTSDSLTGLTPGTEYEFTVTPYSTNAESKIVS
jgi:hypothetical protein